MRHYTKTEIKRTAQAAIYAFTGMEPKLSQLTLLEASDDRTHILFRVNDIEYSFNSYIFGRFIGADGKECESIWCGDGTVERLGRRTSKGHLIK